MPGDTCFHLISTVLMLSARIGSAAVKSFSGGEIVPRNALCQRVPSYAHHRLKMLNSAHSNRRANSAGVVPCTRSGSTVEAVKARSWRRRPSPRPRSSTVSTRRPSLTSAPSAAARRSRRSPASTGQKITVKSQITSGHAGGAGRDAARDGAGRRGPEASAARRSSTRRWRRRNTTLGSPVIAPRWTRPPSRLRSSRPRSSTLPSSARSRRRRTSFRWMRSVRPSGTSSGSGWGEGGGDLNAEAARTAYRAARVGRCKGEKRYRVRSDMAPAPGRRYRPGVALPVGTKAGTSWSVRAAPGRIPVGTWRTSSPLYMKEKCIRCLRCWWSCPEGTIKRQEDDYDEVGLPLLQGLRHLRRHLPGRARSRWCGGCTNGDQGASRRTTPWPGVSGWPGPRSSPPSRSRRRRSSWS